MFDRRTLLAAFLSLGVPAILYLTLGTYDACFLMTMFIIMDIPNQDWRTRNHIDAAFGPIVDAKSAAEAQWKAYLRMRLSMIATAVPVIVAAHFILPHFAPAVAH